MATSLSALKAPAENAVAKKPKSIYDFLTEDKVKHAIAAVAGQYMTTDRFLRLAINAVKKTPRLLECDPQSVLGSFMASAALALEPNTVLGHAYLIPYGVRGPLDDGSGKWGITHYECQFQIGYRGFIALAHRSPTILTLDAEAIHKGDRFKHQKGSQSFLEYEKALTERGELIGAFAFSKLDGGGEAATVLPLDELHKIRSKSETYQALIRKVDAAEPGKKAKEQKKLDDTPWVLWEDDMSAKSAIKKHSKYLPMGEGEPMAAAQALDGADDGKTIDMAQFTDPDKLRQVMADGDLADEGEPVPALTDDAAPTANFMANQQRETAHVETIRGFDDPVTQRATSKAAATDVQSTDKSEAPAGKSRTAFIEGALKSEKNPDELDLLADEIRSLPPADQPRLNKLYRECRAALANAGKPAVDPRQQTINME